MKKLFVIVISILIVMQAAWIVGAKDMSQDNELSLAIEEICGTPSEIESLSFSVYSPGSYRYLWQDYTYFTEDAAIIEEALIFLSNVECSSEAKNAPISDGCFASLKIVKKNGSIFELGYRDVDVLLYKGEYYGGNLDVFAEVLYDIRGMANGDSCIFPHDSKNSYTIDLSEKDVERITYTVKDAEGKEKITAVENDDDNVSDISYSLRKLGLTYDGTISKVPSDASKLVISYDDGKNDIFYIDKGSIEKNKITNGRLWYNGSEYVLDAILFDGFESGFFETAKQDSNMIETETVLVNLASDEKEISAVGYERYAKEEGKMDGCYDFFSIVKDKEYIADIVEQLKVAKVIDISENKPFTTNKYYTETIKLLYDDGNVRKIMIDGNKLFYDGKEYRIYGLSDLFETVCKATRKQRPALECYGEVYDLAIWGETYSLDGEYWFNGRPFGMTGTVTKDELDIYIEDVHTANYIMWLINSSALPYEDSSENIRPSLDVGTELYIYTENGVGIYIAFCKDKRVVMSVGEHMTPSSLGLYMLPYDKAIEIFNIFLDSSDGKLENVQDVEVATDALIDGFYEKCERIKEESDTLSGVVIDEDIYTIRYIDCECENGELKKHTIYDVEGVGKSAKVVEYISSMKVTKHDGGMATGGNVSYTKLFLTDWRGKYTELVFYGGMLKADKEWYTCSKDALAGLRKFMDGYADKTVIDPYADDMKGTALADGIAALLSKPSDIQSFYFCAENSGNGSRSKADAPYDFSYMTSDSAYINEAVKMLSDCEFSMKPKIHEEVGYREVSIRFETKNGKFELKAFSNGKVTCNGEYYGYLSDMCKDVYKLRSKEAGKGIIMKSGTADSAELDLFAKDVVKLTYKDKDVGPKTVTIDDPEKIEKIGAYVRNYISFTDARNAGVADTKSSVLTVEYADGTSGKVFFTGFSEGRTLVQDGATVKNYFVDDYEFDSFEQFFEFYKMSDGIKISDWAKPELEKAVLYGFTGIDDLSDDHKRAITRGETCDILMWPVKDIMGIWSVNFYAPPYQDSMSYEGIWILTGIGAVDGKETVERDGFTFCYFKQDDLVTREELAKIVCGIYRGGDYEYFSGYKADFELPNVTKTSFADDEDISDWAKPYVEMAKNLGIFKGDDMGNFNPKANCTKEEVVAVGVRLYEMMLERAK